MLHSTLLRLEITKVVDGDGMQATSKAFMSYIDPVIIDQCG